MSTSDSVLISEWITWLRAAGRSQGTLDLRRYHLTTALAELGPVSEITTTALAGWLAREGWAPSTRRSVRASLCGFTRWAHATGHIPIDPGAALPAVTVPRGLPRPTTDGVVLGAMRDGRAGGDHRGGLIVEIMATMGLRRGEVSRIHARDLSPAITGGWALRVVGKGGHTRTVPCPPAIAAAIQAASGWLFPGRIDGHLSAAYVGRLASRCLPAGVVPHQLRHRYATVSYARSQDIRAVQALLGHAKLETTAVYVAVADDAVMRAGARAWQIDAA